MSIARLMQMAAAGNSGDPFFNSVELLLHGDGTDGSATIIDSSLNNVTIIANNAAAIDTTTKKFGTGSIEFPNTATADFLNLVDANIASLGSGDFTLEFWLYVSTLSTKLIIDFWEGDPAVNLEAEIYITSGGDLIWFVGSGSGTVGSDAITGTSAISATTWHHVALSRSSGTSKLFVDGSQVGSNYSDSNNYVADTIFIGARPPSLLGFQGYIDDLRITKGVGRYTAAFTPPNKAFPDQ